MKHYILHTREYSKLKKNKQKSQHQLNKNYALNEKKSCSPNKKNVLCR